ncbi:GntR family transcriptional regulator [Streptomyces sp. NPDC059740]|uniref:GntR family transcriptional regulator n=1 Tax=Streptomyces sp. NPDC059740 TaxID=3346926 RepID=UPI00365E6EF1
MGTTQLETVPEPKYWHLKTVLSEALDSEFAVGQVLPNERDLAARFGVARATLRQALEQLELEGRLQRRRGVGTTVAPPRVTVSLDRTERVWPGGPEDAWQPVDATETDEVPAAVARLLDEPGTVHVVRRLLVSYGQPVAAELLYVPVDRLPGLSRIAGGSDATRARAVLRELQHLECEGQDRAVELGSARAEDARELDRLPGAPVLVVTTRYLSANAVAAVAVSTYRADTCRLGFGDTDPQAALAG